MTQDPSQQEYVKKLKQKYAVMRDEIEKLDKSDQSSSLLDCLPFLECRRRCFQSTAAAIGKNKENHEIGRRC